MEKKFAAKSSLRAKNSSRVNQALVMGFSVGLSYQSMKCLIRPANQNCCMDVQIRIVKLDWRSILKAKRVKL